MLRGHDYPGRFGLGIMVFEVYVHGFGRQGTRIMRWVRGARLLWGVKVVDVEIPLYPHEVAFGRNMRLIHEIENEIAQCKRGTVVDMIVVHRMYHPRDPVTLFQGLWQRNNQLTQRGIVYVIDCAFLESQMVRIKKDPRFLVEPRSLTNTIPFVHFPHLCDPRYFSPHSRLPIALRF
jgi:hypothetical protein